MVEGGCGRGGGVVEGECGRGGCIRGGCGI